MKSRYLRSAAISAVIASTFLVATASFGQSAPARAAAPLGPATAPTVQGTVPATPSTGAVPGMTNPVPGMTSPVPGMTNPVPGLPANAPGSIAAPVPPIGSQVTPPATLPGNQSLAPQTAAARLPARSDSAVTAFHALDPTNRGYVTRAEMSRVPGFSGFDNADTNRDGNLSAEEFAAAWKSSGGQ
jgi:hypothetical protein